MCVCVCVCGGGGGGGGGGETIATTTMFNLIHCSRKNIVLYIYTWKKVREHLLCYEGKLWTIIFLQSKYVLTK